MRKCLTAVAVGTLAWLIVLAPLEVPIPIQARGGAATNQSQRPDLESFKSPRQTSSQDRIIHQRAGSFDAGDFYMSAKGKRSLHRMAGSLAVGLEETAERDRVVNRLTAGGGPLAGYTVGLQASDDVIVLQAPEPERKRQREEPAAFQEAANSTKRVIGVRSAGPVFIDPETALYLISNGEIVVALKPDVDPAAYFGADWPNVRRLRGAKSQFILSLGQKSAEALLADVTARAADARVEWAEPNFIMQVIKHFTPNDPLYPDQWNLNNTGQGGGTTNADVNAPEAWNTTRGTNGIVIAVIDSGVQLDHPDLASNIFTNSNEIPDNGMDDDGNGFIDDIHGWDFYSNNNDPNPKDADANHGTAVAGAVAASGNNGLGVVGIAHNCKILPVKMSQGDAFATFATSAAIAEAIRYAGGLTGTGTWRGADIINMSFGLPSASEIDSSLSDAATLGRAGKGCAIFASSGNNASAYTNIALTVPPGDWVFEWRYKKNGSITNGEDTVWLANILFPDGAVERFDAPGLPSGWSTSGNANWSVVDNPARAFGTGRYVAKSGKIAHNQETRLRSPAIHVAATNELVYWLWVSTEPTNDVVAVYASTNGGASFNFVYPGDSGTNFFSTPVTYPASHPNVIAVGAGSDFDYRSDYSRYGSNLDLVAPSSGGRANISTTDRTGTNGFNTASGSSGDYSSSFGGTSAACPLAAGIGALILSVNPDLTASDVRSLMRNSADKIGRVTYTNGFNEFYGYGRVNAQSAVSSALATLPLSIFSPPLSRTNNFGTTATFTVIASGTPPLSYRWQKNATNLSNGGNIFGATTNTLNISDVSSNDAGGYRVIVTNASGSVTSSVATLTVAFLHSTLSDCTEDNFRIALESGGLVTFAIDCTNISLSSPITIASDTILDAAGHTVTLSAGVDSDAGRLFNVLPGVEFTLLNLTLSDGKGTNGGALYINSGSVVTVSNCTFSSNNAIGTDGLPGDDGKDHADIGDNGVRGENGGQGLGGAIYNLGALSLNRCVFGTNSATGGIGGDGGGGGDGDFQGGNGANGGDGGAGYGGAIYSLGTVSIVDCTFAGNSVHGGDGGAGGASGNGTFTGFNGSGGAGGAGSGAGLYCLGRSTIENSTFSDNGAVGGNSAAAGQANNGNGLDGHRGGESFGGGLCNLGTNEILNCTFFGNTVAGGDGGNGGDGDVGGDGGNGGPAWGGGFYNAGVAVVDFSTLSDGGATGGAKGLAGNGTFPGSDGSKGNSRGGNVARNSGSFTLKNSIVANSSSGNNGFGTVIDGGHNISSDGSLGLSAAGSLNNTDPKLGALAANDGFSETMALLDGSPAIDAADDSDCPEFDQRGQARPMGVSCDIGAFEAQPTFTVQGRITEGTNGVSGIRVTAGTFSVTSDTNGNYLIGNLIADDYTVAPAPVGVGFDPADRVVSLGPNAMNINFALKPVQITSIVSTTNGLFRLSFLGGPNRTYRIQASTNLTVWQTISTTTAQTNGVFEFIDAQSKSFPVRFYRASPP